MKNREKYPKIDDAVKAYEEHKKECNCDCSFTDWLDFDEDKGKEFKNELNGSFAASLLGSIGFGLLAGLGHRRDKDAKPKSDSEKSKPDESNGGEPEGVECPICHGKNAKIDGFLAPSLACPDCGCFIGVANSLLEKEPKLRSDAKAFKSFIADLCTKNNAKA